MNLHMKAVRAFKFIVKNKLFITFVCYVVSMCYLLENKDTTTEPTVKRKGYVPVQNYINEKTPIQHEVYKQGEHGRRVIKESNMTTSNRISITRTNKTLNITYKSTSKSGYIFQTSTTKPHVHKTIKENMKSDRISVINNSTFRRISNNTRKVSAMRRSRSSLHNTTYSKIGPPVPLFQEWLDTGEFHCEKESELEGYSKFMRIKNIVIDRKFGSCPSGGERVTDVLRQKEATEFIKMRPGFFEVQERTVSLWQITAISNSFVANKVL